MTYACAFCGEENDTFVDPGGGARQVYTEDCAVCCRPNLIAVTLDADGDAQLEVTQEYEACDAAADPSQSLVLDNLQRDRNESVKARDRTFALRRPRAQSIDATWAAMNCTRWRAASGTS